MKKTLKEGSSKEVIGENIATEIKNGKKKSQAIAIAFSEAGKSKKVKKKSPMMEKIQKGLLLY